MNGIDFGKEIKKLRKKVGIASKELSQQVGKAVTYVSQLERGLIKKPDYTTAYSLLRRLEIEESKIEGILNYFSIMSPEREQAEAEWAIQKAESSFDWFERDKNLLRQRNDRLNASLNMLIDVDVSTADRLISNIESLIADRSKFDFLSSLFEYDYSRLSQEDRNKIISAISAIITSNYTIDEYGELIRRETK